MKKIIIFCFCCVNYFMFAQTGYSGRVEMGINSDYNIMLNTTHGKYLKSNLFAGVGVGILAPMYAYKDEEKNKEFITNAFPVYAEVEYKILDTKFYPFVSARLGLENTFVQERYLYGGDDFGKGNYHFVGGFSPSAGMRLNVVGKLAVELKLSAHFRSKEVPSISKQSYSYTLGIVF